MSTYLFAVLLEAVNLLCFMAGLWKISDMLKHGWPVFCDYLAVTHRAYVEARRLYGFNLNWFTLFAQEWKDTVDAYRTSRISE